MTDSKPVNREEAFRSEAENYLKSFKEKLSELASRKERQEAAKQFRQETAHRQAETFLGDLSDRANFRDSVRARGEEEKKNQEQWLKRQARAYKERLRRYLKPEVPVDRSDDSEDNSPVAEDSAKS